MLFALLGAVAFAAPAQAARSNVSFRNVTAKLAADGTVIVEGHLSGVRGKSSSWRVRLEQEYNRRWRKVGQLSAPAQAGGRFSLRWTRTTTVSPGALRLLAVRKGKVAARSDEYFARQISPAGQLPPRTIGELRTEQLYPGDALRSPSGQYRALLQKAGNFVIIDSASHVLWSSGTAGHPDASLALSDSGTLSIEEEGKVLWRTDSGGFITPSMRLLDEGVLVIFSGNKPIWKSTLGYVGDKLYPGETLFPSEMLQSSSRNTRMVMQTDGSLVTSRWNGTAWVAGCTKATQQYSGATLTWETNGALTLQAENTIYWSQLYAGTNLRALQLTDSDYLVGLYDNGQTQPFGQGCM